MAKPNVYNQLNTKQYGSYQEILDAVNEKMKGIKTEPDNYLDFAPSYEDRMRVKDRLIQLASDGIDLDNIRLDVQDPSGMGGEGGAYNSIEINYIDPSGKNWYNLDQPGVAYSRKPTGPSGFGAQFMNNMPNNLMAASLFALPLAGAAMNGVNLADPSALGNLAPNAIQGGGLGALGGAASSAEQLATNAPPGYSIPQGTEAMNTLTAAENTIGNASVPGLVAGAGAAGGLSGLGNILSGAKDLLPLAGTAADLFMQSKGLDALKDSPSWLEGPEAPNYQDMNMPPPSWQEMGSPTDLYQDPYTQNMLSQLRSTVEGSQAARGLLNSSGTLRKIADDTYSKALLPFMAQQQSYNQGKNQYGLESYNVAQNANQNKNLFNLNKWQNQLQNTQAQNQFNYNTWGTKGTGQMNFWNNAGQGMQDLAMLPWMTNMIKSMG